MRLTPPCPMARDLVGYALHALEPAEELAMTGHPRACRECTGALPGYRAVLADLGSTVQVESPPPRLRRRILDGTGPQLLPHPTAPHHPHDLATARRALGAVEGPDRPAEPPGQAGRRSGRAGRGPWVPRRLAAALLAAACAVVVGGVAGQAVGATGPGLDRTVAALATAGSVHSTLHDERGTPVVAVVASAESVHVVVTDLPANDPIRSVYVLWAIGADAPTPVGTFDAGAGGTRVVTLAAAGTRAVSYAVSLEPGRAAPPSPGRVVAGGQLA